VAVASPAWLAAAVAATWLAAAAVAGPASAQGESATTFGHREDGPGIGTWDNGSWLSEVRLGLLAHNIGPIASAREDGAQLNAELRFDSPDIFEYILSPRPHLGASINTSGDTSFLYFGLTWTWNIYQGLFADFSFGGTVHDGWLDSHDPDPEQRLMGSRLLFRESLELGVRFWDHHSLSVMLDHTSNAGLADKNQGNDDVGLRYGYHF
jgi:lipid A 3-O-deacylase